MSLMTGKEIAELAERGVDVQLHTHGHVLPADRALARREITENREYLEAIVQKKLEHLCYPNGVWFEEHWGWLEELGIRSAMTCEAGLNYRDTKLLNLRRFLDGENISAVEFEAEVSGFTELCRRAFGFARSVARTGGSGEASAARERESGGAAGDFGEGTEGESPQPYKTKGAGR